MIKNIGFKNSTFPLGHFNNFRIGSNTMNCFAAGEVGSRDDFYIIGIEPFEESLTPLISGRFYSAEGEHLITLRNNVISENPTQAKKVLVEGTSFVIEDGEGNEILRVKTQLEDVVGVAGRCYVTEILATLYNRIGEIVFTSNSEEAIASNKFLFGMNGGGGFGTFGGYTDPELEVLRHIFRTKQSIYQTLTGTLTGRSIDFDGKALFRCDIRDCDITLSSGDFITIGRQHATNCRITASGNAFKIIDMYLRVKNSK